MKPKKARFRNTVVCQRCGCYGMPKAMIGPVARAFMKETKDSRYWAYTSEMCRHCRKKLFDEMVKADEEKLGNIDLTTAIKVRRKKCKRIIHGKSWRLRKKLMWKESLRLFHREVKYRISHGLPVRKPAI